MKKYVAVLLFSLGCGFSQSAYAQYIGAWDFNTAFNGADYMANDINTRMMEEVIEGDTSLNNVQPQQQKSESLTYNISKSLRRENIGRFVSAMKKADASNGATIEKLFGGGAIIDQVDQMMRPMGLRADNVADAYTLWWVVAWHAANEKQGDPNPAIMSAVKSQASNALSATQQFSSASNAVKQEMAESLLIQAVMIDSHIDAAVGKPSDQAALAKAVNQGAKKMGLDLTTMDLTEQGFVPRSGKRSDASDAAADAKSGEAGTALAANNPTNDNTAGKVPSGTDQSDASKSDTGKLALYGVGGAALLAGVFALGKSFGGKG